MVLRDMKNSTIATGLINANIVIINFNVYSCDIDACAGWISTFFFLELPVEFALNPMSNVA